MYSSDCPLCGRSSPSSDHPDGPGSVCPNCKKPSAVPPTGADAATEVTTPKNAQSVQQVKQTARYDERDFDDECATPAMVGAGASSWLRLCLVGAVVVGVIVVLASIFLPMGRRVRESAARAQSTNNLMQIAFAFQAFHDVNRRFPFNGSDLDVKSIPYSTAASSGNFHSGSWGFQILPFIDQNQLFLGSGQANALIPSQIRSVPIQAYLCPARGRPPLEQADNGGAWTDYFFNNYLNSPLDANDPAAADARRSVVGVTDGSSNTVMVGHGNVSTLQYALDVNVAGSTNIYQGGTAGTMRAGHDGRRAPAGVTLQRDSEARPLVGSWGGPFSQGALMAMADGSTRMVAYHTDHFSTLLTPDGDD